MVGVILAAGDGTPGGADQRCQIPEGDGGADSGRDPAGDRGAAV